MSRLWKYPFALGSLVLVTGILLILRGVLNTTLIALLYLVSLGIITARWGLAPGLTSAVLTFFVFNYFFIQPYYTFAVHRPADVVIGTASKLHNSA